jgi:hypothetical protein
MPSAQKQTYTVMSVKTSSGKVKGKDNLGGRFISSSPSGAAKKAGTQICRASNIKGQCSLVIVIRKTTQGGNKKEYTYKVTRVKDPVTVMRGGEEITYNYKTKAKRLD